MRTRFYGALVTLGLVATVLAKTGHAEMLTSTAPGVELVIDEVFRPKELQLTFNSRRESSRDIADGIAAEPGDASRLNFVLASPGIFFGVPRDFFPWSVHLSRPAPAQWR